MKGETTGSLGFVSILTIVFIVLKLCKIIDWSWVWVLSPRWISMLLWRVIIMVVYVVWRIKR